MQGVKVWGQVGGFVVVPAEVAIGAGKVCDGAGDGYGGAWSERVLLAAGGQRGGPGGVEVVGKLVQLLEQRERVWKGAPIVADESGDAVAEVDLVADGPRDH